MDHTANAALNLQRLLCALTVIPDDEWNWLLPSLQPRAFASGESVFRPGSTDASIHYICRGVLRYYYLSERGIERNHTFAFTGNLVACFPVIADGRDCPFTIETLEPTETLAIDQTAVRTFSQRHACWSELLTRLMAHVALRKAKREEELLVKSAEERYQSFLAEFGERASRIPQYHIASYLGITPVALSRIRRRINPG